MQVTIQMRLEEALDVQTGQPATPALQKVLKIVKELGDDLKPIHPGATHHLLAPYFTVEVPDRGIANELISSLLSCQAIEAAYLEPPVKLPSG
jgi:hypothetical protein